MFPAAAGAVALAALTATGEAQAACTVENALELVAGGFSQEQVDRICAILDVRPGGAEGALDPESSDPASSFRSDVLTPDIGRDGTWTKFVREETYILQNKSDPASGYVLLSAGHELAWESFGVEVRFTHEALAEGVVGPVLAFGAGGGRTRLMSVAHDGTCQAAELGKNGVTVSDIRRDPARAVGDFEWVELDVVRRGDKAELLVRGQPTGLAVPVDVASGPIGIGVFGIGGYEFRRFRHAESAPAAAPTAQGGKG